MKILIQLIFNNGIGNLYCGMVEIMDFLHPYKESGYFIELVFASNGGGGSNKYINYCNIEEIFDENYLMFFDKITNLEMSITDRQYGDYKYHSTQYGPNNPGIHWWDVFVSSDDIIVNPKKAFNVETLLSRINVPNYLPKYNSKIHNRVETFLSKKNKINKVIQIRYFDYRLNPEDDFVKFCDLLNNKIKLSSDIFYISSNNQYILDVLKLNQNVVTYEYENINELPNDQGYYFYHKNFERDFLLSRLYDNICESVILSLFDEIYYFTSYSWSSTYLYYALSNNPKLKLIELTKENINNIL
jgi:hypothetical protein